MTIKSCIRCGGAVGINPPFRAVPTSSPPDGSSYRPGAACAWTGRGGRCDPTPLAYPSRLAGAGWRRDEPEPGAGGEKLQTGGETLRRYHAAWSMIAPGRVEDSMKDSLR